MPYQVIKLDACTFGIIEGDCLDIYHNHAGNGAGCNNLVIDHPTEGTLDLEFCQSVEIFSIAG